MTRKCEVAVFPLEPVDEGGYTYFIGHLGGLAIEPLAADDVVVTVADPDGRKVMFGTV